MPQKIGKKRKQPPIAPHHYYLDIINSVPNVVYWIDTDCRLLGCNNKFVKMLGLKRPKDFIKTPYDLMEKFTSWPRERIDSCRLDDMKVIFSGEAQYDVEDAPFIDKDDNTTFFRTNRVPLLDDNKQIIGLVVVLTDISDSKKPQALESEITALLDHKIDVDAAAKEPNVLMVEDNYITQNVEEALLKALNCHVDIAESGEKAVGLFNPGKYDLVLMDIGLEDTSGYMVAKKLRHMEKDTNFHVPIIALTSYQADIVKYDCSEYFMDGVLSKPLTSEQVRQIIQHFIFHKDVPVTGLKKVN